MDGRDPGKRKAEAGETSKDGGGAKNARQHDARAGANVNSTDAVVVGGASWSSADGASETAGGDGASSVDTSLTLGIGATATRTLTATRVWSSNSTWRDQQVSAKSECASNSDAATLSDAHHIPAVEGLAPVVDATTSTDTGSSRNDPAAIEVPDDERCPACLTRMGLSEDQPIYHICLCEVCLTRAAICPVCGIGDQMDQIGSPSAQASNSYEGPGPGPSM